jgi:hypothetical protein
LKEKTGPDCQAGLAGKDHLTRRNRTMRVLGFTLILLIPALLPFKQACPNVAITAKLMVLANHPASRKPPCAGSGLEEATQRG